MDSWVVNKKHTGGRRKKNVHIIISNSIINHATHKGGRRNTQLGGETETNINTQGVGREMHRGETQKTHRGTQKRTVMYMDSKP